VRPIKALTSIRGVAAWWVVLYHFQDEIHRAGGDFSLGIVSHGYLAVDLFFILSGFVIGLNYAATFRSMDVGQYARFLMIRIARIYPLHIFMLAAFCLNLLAIVLFSTSRSPGDRFGMQYFLLSAGLLQNWGFTDRLAWNPPAWSISTEWAAYLVFPFLACGATNLLRRPAAAAAAAIALLLLLFGGFQVLGPSIGADIPRLGLLRCLLEFSTGLCLYRFWSMRGGRAAPHAGWALLGAALLGTGYALLPLRDYLIWPAAFALLIYALSCRDHWWVRLMQAPLLVAAGEVSYATYLVHYFIKDWMKFLLVGKAVPASLTMAAYLILTAAASVLLYRFIEVPGRRAVRAMADRIGRQSLSAVAGTPS
jgi:peptidoglycan/LPS O-acetylase OafA/YrhL